MIKKLICRVISKNNKVTKDIEKGKESKKETTDFGNENQEE